MKDGETLTAREHEVLALVRQGLTNEQIAERLGISSDGVKYHVSQITSQLGVSSRHEAVDAASREETWWGRALTGPLWLIAGAATVAAAVAGVAVMAWGVAGSNHESSLTETQIKEMTVEQLYERIVEAVSREDEILHSVATTSGLNGRRESDTTSTEIWVDPDLQAMYSRTAGQGQRFTEQGETREANGDDFVDVAPPECDVPAVWLGAFLACLSDAKAVLDSDRFNGSTVLKLKYERSYSSESNAGTLLESSVVYLDATSLLPLRSIFTVVIDGEIYTELDSRYVHEFVPKTPDLLSLLDPDR